MLINLGSKINAMRPSFAQELSFQVCWTNIGAQKINGSKLETFNIVIAFFLVDDKIKNPASLEKVFY